MDRGSNRDLIVAMTGLHNVTSLLIKIHVVISLVIVIWSFISKIPNMVTVEILLFLLPIVLLIINIVECSHRGNCKLFANLILFIYIFLSIMFVLIQSERKHTLLLPM